MASSFRIKVASTDAELDGILKLQSLNLKDSVEQLEGEEDGSVTLQRDIELLKYINSFMGQVIAVDNTNGGWLCIV